MLWKTAGPFSGEEAQGSGHQQQSRGNFTEVPAVVSVVVLCCCHGLGAVGRMQL